MTSSLLPNVAEFIYKLDPFDKLPRDLCMGLADKISISYLAKGEQLPLGSEHSCYLYIIRTGALEQRKPDGVLRAVLGPEDVFGFTFLNTLENALDGYTVTAIENTLLYQVPHDALNALLKQCPEYAELFAAQAQIRLNSALNVVWSSEEKGIFVRTVAEVASHQVAIVNADDSIQNVAIAMRKVHRSPTAVIMEKGVIAGVITDRDMTKRVVARGLDSSLAVRSVMTPSPVTVSPSDLVLHAAAKMMQHNIRTLPVVDKGQVTGILTTSHLVQNHRVQAIFLIEKIKYAESVDALVTLSVERQAIFEALVAGNVSAAITGQVMTLVMDAYTKKLLALAEQKLGAPPTAYCWMVAGSHARNEVHQLSDQDSAIVYQDTTEPGVKTYFHHLAMYVSKGLSLCGYPVCPGNFMAANPKWCRPLSVWQAYFKKWSESPEYDRLLNISVFLELRALHGQAEMVETLQQHLLRHISGNNEFLIYLVRSAVSVSPPLGIFNNLVLEKSGDNT